MAVFRRDRIEREIRSSVRAKIREGKDKDTIRQEIRGELKERYGDNVNWEKILEIALKILELVLKFV